MQKVFIKPTVPHKLLLGMFALDPCKAILMILFTIFSSESEEDFRNLEIFSSIFPKRFLWTGWKPFWYSYQRILLKISRSSIIFSIYPTSSQSKSLRSEAFCSYDSCAKYYRSKSETELNSFSKNFPALEAYKAVSTTAQISRSICESFRSGSAKVNTFIKVVFSRY